MEKLRHIWCRNIGLLTHGIVMHCIAYGNIKWTIATGCSDIGYSNIGLVTLSIVILEY